MRTRPGPRAFGPSAGIRLPPTLGSAAHPKSRLRPLGPVRAASRLRSIEQAPYLASAAWAPAEAFSSGVPTLTTASPTAPVVGSLGDTQTGPITVGTRTDDGRVAVLLRTRLGSPGHFRVLVEVRLGVVAALAEPLVAVGEVVDRARPPQHGPPLAAAALRRFHTGRAPDDGRHDCESDGSSRSLLHDLTPRRGRAYAPRSRPRAGWRFCWSSPASVRSADIDALAGEPGCAAGWDSTSSTWWWRRTGRRTRVSSTAARPRNATPGWARGSSATWPRGYRWSGPRGRPRVTLPRRGPRRWESGCGSRGDLSVPTSVSRSAARRWHLEQFASPSWSACRPAPTGARRRARRRGCRRAWPNR